MLIFILDNKLNEHGLKRSKMFMGGRERPKIILPVLDLIQKYQSDMTMQNLLKTVIDQEAKAKFHHYFRQNGDFLQNLQNYDLWFNLNYEEFTENEDLLLEFLSKHCKRKIQFISILKPAYRFQYEKTFGYEFDKEFSIFGYRFCDQSFYISAIKLQ